VTPPTLARQLQSLPPMLHIYTLGTMPNCSKAPRGLFVLLRTDGIFTVNALSPSSSSRQYPYHYAIRAGQNLPDKEFRSFEFNYCCFYDAKAFACILHVAMEIGLYLAALKRLRRIVSEGFRYVVYVCS